MPLNKETKETYFQIGNKKEHIIIINRVIRSHMGAM